MQVIQDAVDSADEGVILFSLGFSFIPDRLPKAQVLSMIKSNYEGLRRLMKALIQGDPSVDYSGYWIL